jgi:hypothetical protein
LAEYDYEIVHKSGSQNTNVDALSRIGSVGTIEEQTDIPDAKARKQILYEFHDSPVGGHRGMNKTYLAISSQYTWPKMRSEVESYVKQCRSCHIKKAPEPQYSYDDYASELKG